MSLQPIIILCLTLTTLLVLCAVVTLLLYRRSPKRWYWLASAAIDGFIAYFLYDGLLGFFGLSRPLALILSLVLAGLLYAVAILLYRRSGVVSTRQWYVLIGVFAAVLLIFALLFVLLDFFVPGSSLGLGLVAGLAPLVAYQSIISALGQRSRTR